MTAFAPIAFGSSVTVDVTQSSQTFALPTLPADSPAIRLIARNPNQIGWTFKLGTGAVTVSETDGQKRFPGSLEGPLIVPVTGGETHIAILCEGSPGAVSITSGSLLSGNEFAPSGASQIIAVTQAGVQVVLPALPASGAVIALSEGGAQMEAVYLRFGDNSVGFNTTTSMKARIGPIARPLLVGVPAGATHMTIQCDGMPGPVRLTPGSMSSAEGDAISQLQTDVSALQTGKIGTINVQTFTASGTYTPSAGLIRAWVRLVGGGGGGGGADGNATPVCGAGGGAGGYVEEMLSAATIGASQAVTIGAAGAAGSDAGGNGGNGGTSSLGVLLSATGGAGGAGTGAASTSITPTSGGLGGVGSGGNINGTGMPGGQGFRFDTGGGIRANSGNGGSSPWGGGGRSRSTFDSAGEDATGFGAGGSGAADDDTTGSAGGAGTAGYMIITEYLA